MAIRPRSGANVPASTFIRVDLPAPLWPTSPTHSPAPTARSTPSSARTAPKCFSTPSSRAMRGDPPTVTGRCRRDSRPGPCGEAPSLLLHVGLDGLQRLVLGVFVARHTTFRNGRQHRLEIVL